MNDTTEATLADFTIGQRVELHPATDRWMMGDRYGTIVKLDERYRGARARLLCAVGAC
jgi:hypothetical protein